jgi:hypothetical protein
VEHQSIEHVLGRPPERTVPTFSFPEDADQIHSMTWDELRLLAADLPVAEHVTIARPPLRLARVHDECCLARTCTYS